LLRCTAPEIDDRQRQQPTNTANALNTSRGRFRGAAAKEPFKKA
jgi:hypothetical protein